MSASRFSKVRIPRTSGNRMSGDVITRLAGLDMVSPVDEIREGRTPDAHDFRLYSQTEAGREVAVSSRKGSGYYTDPLGESMNTSNIGSVGVSSVDVGVDTNIQLQRFTAASDGLLTRIDLEAALGDATSVIRIDVHEDLAGNPGRLLTSSSLSDLGVEFNMLSARFINSVALTSGSNYWIVAYLQDDGQGFAKLRTNTSGHPARKASGSILGAVQQGYSLLYMVYTAPEAKPLGAYRFNREDGVNRTLAAYGTTMYVVDETKRTLVPLLPNLSPNASSYSFANGDGKVFWANGYDRLACWNGVMPSESVNIVSNSGFEVNTTDWSGGGGSTIERVPREYIEGSYSLRVSAFTGERVAVLTQALEQNKRYRISFWAKGESSTGNISVTQNGQTIPLPGSQQPISTQRAEYELYYTTGADVNTLEFRSASDDFYIDNVTIQDCGIEFIQDSELPILKEICFHKDRLFGVSAEDGNKLVFSENPGNPSDKPVREQWYRQWLSVSFIYVPRPKNGSPITALVPFQDSLTIFTQDRKYILSGSDRGNYYLRESVGSKGALSRRGVVSDSNFIYFVSDEGIYRYDGSKDEKISTLVQPLFDRCPLKHEISLTLWRSDLRAYMASQGSPTHDITAIFSNDFAEWMLDTNTWVSRSLYYDDADDQMELAEFSSQTATLYKAEQGYNALGAPIDFDYRLKYDSRGVPGQRKKFKRYVPLVQAVGTSFPITFGVDRDFEDSPREKKQQLNVGGVKIGSFRIGDGTILTGKTAFKPKKTSISGYSRYMQFRVKRCGVNNQVAFMGVQFTYKSKKL